MKSGIKELMLLLIQQKNAIREASGAYYDTSNELKNMARQFLQTDEGMELLRRADLDRKGRSTDDYRFVSQLIKVAGLPDPCADCDTPSRICEEVCAKKQYFVSIVQRWIEIGGYYE